jgi:Collagen triple helix repeat (20 copies)
MNRISEPFGKAGLIVAIVALVAALVGGAYAATASSRHHKKSNAGLNGKQRKEVKKISKQYAGKPGAAGPAGPQGLPGANGSNGARGNTGPEGPEGPEGKEGPKGKEGSPWTAGGTLPEGATETGYWAASGTPVPTVGGLFNAVSAPISFGIPLAEAPELGIAEVPSETELENEEFPAPPTGCTGNVAEPGAEEGYLCIFPLEMEHTEGAAPVHFKAGGGLGSGFEGNPGPQGGLLVVLGEEAHPEEPVTANGTWAVTGP